MTKFTATRQLIAALLAGVVLGYIGGPVQILALWAVVGLSVGYASISLRSAVLSGGVFGFVMSFIFMIHGYHGANPLASVLLPFALLGGFGGLCGALLGVMGMYVQKLLRKKHAS